MIATGSLKTLALARAVAETSSILIKSTQQATSRLRASGASKCTPLKQSDSLSVHEPLRAWTKQLRGQCYIGTEGKSRLPIQSVLGWRLELSVSRWVLARLG